MKYMMMFWVDESAAATPDEDAAMLRSKRGPTGTRPWDH